MTKFANPEEGGARRYTGEGSLEFVEPVDFGPLVRAADAIYFERGLTWPHPGSDAERKLREAAERSLMMGHAAVITRIDVECGAITIDNARLCDQTWPLQPCEVQS